MTNESDSLNDVSEKVDAELPETGENEKRIYSVLQLVQMRNKTMGHQVKESVAPFISLVDRHLEVANKEDRRTSHHTGGGTNGGVPLQNQQQHKMDNSTSWTSPATAKFNRAEPPFLPAVGGNYPWQQRQQFPQMEGKPQRPHQSVQQPFSVKDLLNSDLQQRGGVQQGGGPQIHLQGVPPHNVPPASTLGDLQWGGVLDALRSVMSPDANITLLHKQPANTAGDKNASEKSDLRQAQPHKGYNAGDGMRGSGGRGPTPPQQQWRFAPPPSAAQQHHQPYFSADAAPAARPYQQLGEPNNANNGEQSNNGPTTLKPIHLAAAPQQKSGQTTPSYPMPSPSDVLSQQLGRMAMTGAGDDRSMIAGQQHYNALLNGLHHSQPFVGDWSKMSNEGKANPVSSDGDTQASMGSRPSANATRGQGRPPPHRGAADLPLKPNPSFLPTTVGDFAAPPNAADLLFAESLMASGQRHVAAQIQQQHRSESQQIIQQQLSQQLQYFADPRHLTPQHQHQLQQQFQAANFQNNQLIHTVEQHLLQQQQQQQRLKQLNQHRLPVAQAAKEGFFGAGGGQQHHPHLQMLSQHSAAIPSLPAAALQKSSNGSAAIFHGSTSTSLAAAAAASDASAAANSRKHQIAITKSTEVYRRTIAANCGHDRRPSTPEPSKNISHRMFSKELQKWRAGLHALCSALSTTNAGVKEDKEEAPLMESSPTTVEKEEHHDKGVEQQKGRNLSFVLPELVEVLALGG